MHDSVMGYVNKIVSVHGLSGKSCLDVGALDVNGSVRHLFTGEYVGTDMRPGRNVDQVVKSHDLLAHFGSERFDVVVCVEMLEHDSYPWISMQQMGAVLKPGGRLILTTRGPGYPLHDHPSDYYRYTVEGGRIMAELAGLTEIQVEEDSMVSGICMTGVKRGN